MKTHCARMDHGGCALLVGVEHGKIVRIKADPDGYLNRGHICIKGLHSADKLYHPERLTRPLKRIGKRGEGKWKEISWEQAIDEISKNFLKIRDEYGAKAVAFCQGMPKGLEHFVLIRLANIFGSPNVVAVQDVCHAPREITGIHTCGFYPVVDFHHSSNLVVLWGSNITDTNEEGEISKLLLDQLKQGTKLIVVDPMKISPVDKADIWLQIRPGADHALALSMLNVIMEEGLFDRDFVDKWTHGFAELANHVKKYPPEKMSEFTWIPSGQIRQAARLYATSKPAAIQWGNPIEQNINNFHTSRALICLMAITGNLDIPGGNIQANEPRIMGLGKFVRADLIPWKRKEMIHAYYGAIARLMTVPPVFFRKAVLEEKPYPIKGAYIQCANPLLSYADTDMTLNALKKLDFFAVADIFMTPTAWLADIVLPVATQYEFNDMGHYGLGHGILLARPKIVDPPEYCWPDIKILNELGKNMTSPQLWFENYEEMLDMILEPANLKYKEFSEKGYLVGEEKFKKYLDQGFRTPTGKVELQLSKAEELGVPSLPSFQGLPEQETEEFPFVLTSAKSPYFLHSSYRWVEKLKKREPEGFVKIHPATAHKLDIREGDRVIIETSHGKITQTAKLTDKIHPKIVYASYGWWSWADSGMDWETNNFNMLTQTTNLGKEFGTPNLKALCCKIYPA